jgi:hypothetical protein
MHDDVFAFSITVPAGTAKAAPLTQDTSFNPAKVRKITWHFPRGPMGTTGFRVTSGRVQIIPANTGGWIVRDGASGQFDLRDSHDSGKWEIQAYNTGINPHMLFVEFHIVYHQRRPKLLTLFSAETLAPVPDLHDAGPPLFR